MRQIKNCLHDPDAVARRADAARRRRDPPDARAATTTPTTRTTRRAGSTGRWSSRTASMLRFVQRMIAFRKAHPRALAAVVSTRGAINERGLPDIAWHGTRLNSPGFDDPDARALACTIAGFGGAPDLHVMMNMFWEPLEFEVPRASAARGASRSTRSSSPRTICPTRPRGCRSANQCSPCRDAVSSC